MVKMEITNRHIVKFGGDSLELLFPPFGRFDDIVSALAKEGANLGTCEQAAMVDIAGGGLVDKVKMMVAESVVYLPNGEILLTSGQHSPLLSSPEEACVGWYASKIDDRVGGYNFYVSDGTAERLRGLAETNPDRAIESGVLLLDRRAMRPYSFIFEEISPGRLADSDSGRFLFQTHAEAYGKWLEETRGVRMIQHHTLRQDWVPERPICNELYWSNSNGLTSYPSNLGSVSCFGVHILAAEVPNSLQL